MQSIARRQARILAMQALCQFDALGDGFLPELDGFLTDESPPAEVLEYARRLFTEARIHLKEIDEHLTQAMPNWQIGRLADVERNVLRAAVCELLYHADVPPRAALNEAIEIAREYGAAKSPGFVNGVLDAVMKKVETRNPEVVSDESPREAGPEQLTSDL